MAARTMQTVKNYTKQYINGEWVASTNGMDSLIDVFDSNTAKVFARVPRGSRTDTERAIEAAAVAFQTWSRTSLEERKDYLVAILNEYKKRKIVRIQLDYSEFA